MDVELKGNKTATNHVGGFLLRVVEPIGFNLKKGGGDVNETKYRVHTRTHTTACLVSVLKKASSDALFEKLFF